MMGFGLLANPPRSIGEPLGLAAPVERVSRVFIKNGPGNIVGVAPSMGVMASGSPRHEAGVGSKLIIVVARRPPS
jgi:hypothetical protein